MVVALFILAGCLFVGSMAEVVLHEARWAVVPFVFASALSVAGVYLVLEHHRETVCREYTTQIVRTGKIVLPTAVLKDEVPC